MFAGRTQVKTKIRWEVPSSGSHEPLCLHCFLCHSQLSLATLPGLTCILSTDEWMDRWMDGWTDGQWQGLGQSQLSFSMYDRIHGVDELNDTKHRRKE